MSIVHDEFAGFQQFAEAKLHSGEVESLDELFDLWRMEHPTPDEQDDIQQAIQEGLADLKAGRYRSADEVNRDLERKHQLPASMEQNLSATNFDGELESLLFDGPSLPAAFSRRDIYDDHN